jgi:hypothetical protein
LKNWTEWYEYCKSGNKPDDIPASPNTTYKNKGWISFGDWLGTGSVAPKDMVFRDFESAREFARSLGLKNYTEWNDYCKSGNKPEDIPAIPSRTYKNKGWIGMGDWLGTGNVHKKEFRDFKSAREFVRGLKLKRQVKWLEYCKSGNKPEDIPTNPQRIYKNKGWIGMGDWFGTGSVAPKDMVFRDFESAREFVRSLKLKSVEEWREYCKSDNKPNNIPVAPYQTYKNNGWIDWGDWLGTGSVATQKLSNQYLPFKDARDEARKLAKQYNIKNWNDWRNAVKKGLIPKNIPSYPNESYSKKRKKDGKKV